MKRYRSIRGQASWFICDAHSPAAPWNVKQASTTLTHQLLTNQQMNINLNGCNNLWWAATVVERDYMLPMAPSPRPRAHKRMGWTTNLRALCHVWHQTSLFFRILLFSCHLFCKNPTTHNTRTMAAATAITIEPHIHSLQQLQTYQHVPYGIVTTSYTGF